MHKRTKYFINKRLQLRLIILTVLLVICVISIFNLFSFSTVFQLEKKTDISVYGKTVPVEDIDITERYVIGSAQVKGIILIDLLLIVLLMISVIIHSHHVAGPIYHLHKHLEGMAAGNLHSELQFRRRDEFQFLADTVNRLQKKLKECLNDEK